MEEKHSPGFRFFCVGTLAAARCAAGLTRLLDTGNRGAQGLLVTALGPEEMEELTIRLYDARPGAYRPEMGLSDWERDWFARALPPPPATVLVAAAGAGREVVELIRLGYQVDAFEPAQALFSACRRLMTTGSVVRSDYRGFADAVLADGGTSPCASGPRTYDAILLGWSSLSHVLDREQQERVLQAASKLCPVGPMLASCLVQRAAGDAGRLRRAEAAGRMIGSRLARVRHIPPGERSYRFLWQSGFLYVFSVGELETLAAGLDRRLHLQFEPYPHLELLPG